MEHLNKVLFHLQNSPKLFKQEDIGFILGLTNTQIKELKKELISQKLIEEKQKEFFLTDLGAKYLKEHPFEPSEINLEYLKLEKTPSIVTKAIRNLAKHLLSGEELKKNSTEDYIKREVIDSKKFTNYLKEFESHLLGEQRRQFTSLNFPELTKSVFAVLLLYMLSKNLDKIALFEKGQFVLTLDYLVFDRIICCPQNFEIQLIIVENNSVLTNLSELFLPEKSNNILDITKGLYRFIKKLESYTLNTERLSKKTLRFRNVILNAKDPVNLFYRDIPKVLSNKLLKECNDEFAIAFKNAINELENAKAKLSEENKNFLLTTFKSSSREKLSERFSKIEDYIGENELKILSSNIRDTESNDSLWIDRISTFINKSRVPKDWKDSDVADYKLKVKELALKFFIIESIAGDITCYSENKISKILKEIEVLSNNEKNILLRKIINV